MLLTCLGENTQISCESAETHFTNTYLFPMGHHQGSSLRHQWEPNNSIKRQVQSSRSEQNSSKSSNTPRSPDIKPAQLPLKIVWLRINLLVVSMFEASISFDRWLTAHFAYHGRIYSVARIHTSFKLLILGYSNDVCPGRSTTTSVNARSP
jgi:hypothetical protein